MRHLPAFIVLAASAVVAAPAPAADTVVVRTTAARVDTFAGCFTNAQDREARPWWFVAKGTGGTFSNLGANGVSEPYFLDVADRGTSREVRLAQSAADPSVLRAVDRCLARG